MALIAVRYGHADEEAGRALAAHLDAGDQPPQDLTHEEVMGVARDEIARRAAAADAVVYVWSAKSEIVDDLAQRDREILVEALAAGNLIFAKVDDVELPLGYRDLPAERIDAEDPGSFDRLAFQAKRRVEAKKAAMGAAPPVDVRSRSVGAPSKPPPGAAPSPEGRDYGSNGFDFDSPEAMERLDRAGNSAARLGVVVLLAAAGAAAAWFFKLQSFLAAADVAGQGERIAAAPSWAFLIGAGVATLIAAVLVVSVIGAVVSGGSKAPAPRKRTEAAPAAEAAEPEPLAGDIVFVSYARRDSRQVDDVAGDLTALGFDVWMDRADMHGGAGWAGQIVGAIRESKAQLVMCSAAAFQSDHVAREIYLADHFNKPLVPVFIEDAEPPDELLYFLVRPQRVFLHDADEATRRARLAEAMAAI